MNENDRNQRYATHHHANENSQSRCPFSTTIDEHQREDKYQQTSLEKEARDHARQPNELQSRVSWTESISGYMPF